jgi:hypothetical protein
MVLRYRAIHRLTGLMARWGLVEHPYGQEYARERYTLTGRRRPDSAFESGRSLDRRRTGLVVGALVLASLLATGLLFSL